MKLFAQLQGSPDALALLAISGLLLIYVELNRPGFVIPGTVGLLVLLLAVAQFAKLHWTGVGAVLLSTAASMQILALRRRVIRPSAALAGVATFVGCRAILRGENVLRISIPTALVAALMIGPGTSVLTAIARRARRNKGLDLA